MLPMIESLESAEWGDGLLYLPVILAVIGACVGSFLNVVVYRMPRGISVRKPARSFCPACGKPIPWYLNIPLLSWLALRGRSACCRRPIAVRYWLLEAACAGFFYAVGWVFAYEALVTQVAICLWGAALLALLAMDWEQMVVEPRVVVCAALCGLVAAVCDPALVAEWASEYWEGLVWGLGGALVGYAVFRLVALGGRLFFGRRSCRFPEAVSFYMRQEGEDIVLTAGGRDFLWSEVFLEDSDRLVLEQAEAPALSAERGRIILRADRLVLPGGECRSLETLESLSGSCCGVQICREAMGSGDAWLALAIGSLCGWQGVIFALVGGSFIGLGMALVCRIRRGVPMPFGPSLILAAFLWLFWGPQLLALYRCFLTGTEG